MAEKITAIKGVPLAEVVARGQAIVDALPVELLAAHDGQVVAVDIDSGAFGVAQGVAAAKRTLRAERPDAVIYLARLGRPALYGFGAASRRAAP